MVRAGAGPVPELAPYILDESVEIAPGLVWCGEMNIIPTAPHPLNGLEQYRGLKSIVVPHARMELESVASMADEATKLCYSTGTVTQRNYIRSVQASWQSSRHDYGGVLVEVDAEGNWFVRQLSVGADGSVADVGPSGTQGVRVVDGQVRWERVTRAVTWGDAYVAEMEHWVRQTCWGPDGMLDQLRPATQFLHDVFSMRSRSHHEAKDPHARFIRHVEGEDTVEDEAQVTADFLCEARREFCETVVVHSNPDRHLSKWLQTADYREDPVNATYFLHLQLETYRAMERGDRDFNPLEFALRGQGCPPDTRFLAKDESFVLLGVEHGLHGDLGPNGSRGSTRNLTKLGRPINKGHDHTASIRDGVFSAGACAVRFPYMLGPSSHSVSHILTYENGTRCLVTMWNGRWRVEQPGPVFQTRRQALEPLVLDADKRV